VAPDTARLRLLIAELDDELGKVQRLFDQFGHAEESLRRPNVDHLIVYGVAALLESFYTSMEKSLARIANTLGPEPVGPSWHRQLLMSMTLDVPEVRPAVLNAATALALDSFLSFRHRFRNLYVFDLEHEPMLRLLAQGASACSSFETDIRALIAHLREWIVALEAS